MQVSGLGVEVVMRITPEKRVAVVVVASAPHRQEAFAAARFGIDTVKSSVPIWKRERWDGGETWAPEAQVIVEAGEL